ncbi:MAG: geranylgeranyl reductase family protein [Actinomycetota bacterium]
MSEYDAIVIGAGPGGSSAAYFLANAGKKVLVLDKKDFPRAKVCGDGLTPRSLRVMEEMGLTPLMDTYQKIRGLRIVGAGRMLELDFPKLSNFRDYGLVRPRKNLDFEVMQQAKDAGAEFRMKTEAFEPIFEGTKMTGVRWIQKKAAKGGGVVKSDEGVVSAPFTIIADGASSSFGRKLGIQKDKSYPLGLAIRTYYKSDRANDDYFESWLELKKDGDLLPGYGWVFPVGDGTVNVGVGLLTTFGRWRGVNLNHLQRGFVDMLTKTYGITHEDQTEPYKSGRLPLGGSVHKPYGDGYLLIGDAAGIVNPFNGEGIAYALETGKLAAGMVAQATSEGNRTELPEYRAALHEAYAAYYRVGRIFTQCIARPQVFRAMCQVGLRSKTMMSFVLQVLANLYETKGGTLADRNIRRMLILAEQDLPELKAPDFPMPKGSREKKDTATKGAA